MNKSDTLRKKDKNLIHSNQAKNLINELHRKTFAIPAYAKQLKISGLEEINIPTWSFFGITNAWVFNIGNISCELKMCLVSAEYQTIEPGGNIRIQVAGGGSPWFFKNTTWSDEANGIISLISLFTW